VAQELAEFARSLGLRFQCQKPGCQKPSALEVGTPRGMPRGAFYFRHLGPRGSDTHHVGASAIPVLRLIPPE
jgi:hypothetical protein